MKVNEIPEKIYLSYETDDEDYKNHIFIDYMWHRHPSDGKNLKNVEYVRTDAFIEKARKWFEMQNEWVDLDGNYKCDMTDFEDFKKYIEGE